VSSYPPEVAADAWDACKGTYPETLRLRLRASTFAGVTNAELADEAAPLAFEALQLAPEELLDDLHTMQDGFRHGTRIPDAVVESMIDYHLSVCGAWVVLGSMD